MSRVERTEDASERGRPERSREAQQSRTSANRPESPGHTPGKAEGEDLDIEEALESQKE